MLRSWTKFRRALRAFRAARKGNVAITFAFAAIPAIGCIGAGYDYSHANSVNADMQVALDSAALMLAKNAATLSQDDLNTKAHAYFTADFNRPDATVNSVGATYTTNAGSQVTVTAQVQVPTTFLRTLDLLHLAAMENIAISGSSTTTWGTSRLRVALVLDNTGSMADDGNMDALKSATHSLLTQLQNAATTNGDVYVSIIPFSRDVNVGAINYSANWIDWSDWEDDNGSWQQTTSCSAGYGHSRHGHSHCNNNWTWTVADHSAWNGCVTDRDQNYDQNVTAPNPADVSLSGNQASTLFPAEQYSSCPVAMKGLSYDWTSMSSLVDSMQPNGSTNQPIGLVWGWMALAGGGPFTAPALDANYTYQKVIVLMSDGLNTQDRWYGNGRDVSTDVDHRMVATDGTGTCANIKAAGITIYTIHVNTGGDPTSTLLQSCASDSKKFWMVTSSSGIGTVFQQIGTQLSQLRVVR
jgi:Flp pilus assembly protein TadG